MTKRRPTGRKAIIPDVTALPDRIDPSGLVLTLQNEDGTRKQAVDMTRKPGPLLVKQQLVAAVARLNGPSGSWKSLETAESALQGLAFFLRWTESVPLDSLAQLTPDVYDVWLEHVAVSKASSKASTRNSTISRTRMMLRECVDVPEATQEKLRHFFSEPLDTAPRQHYTLGEYESIKRAALVAVGATQRRIRENWALARIPRNQVSAEHILRWEALQDVLSGNNPRSTEHYRAVDCLEIHRYEGGGKGYIFQPSKARMLLYPNSHEAIAMVALLIAETGENLSMVANRSRPSTAPTLADEETVFRSETDKPRRGPGARYQQENATSTSPLGATLGRIMEVTEPAWTSANLRGLPEKDSLIIWCHRNGSLVNLHGTGFDERVRRNPNWMPDGIDLAFTTLHRTVVTRVKQRPIHNNAKTFVETYLALDDEACQGWEDIAREGIDALFAHARTSFAKVLSAQQAEADPAYANDNLTPTGVSCRNCDLNPRTGQPCNDPWLECLGCSNAFALPEHLSTLIAVHDLLETLRASGEDEAIWETRHSLAWARSILILESVPTSELERARGLVTSATRQAVADAVVGRVYEI